MTLINVSKASSKGILLELCSGKSETDKCSFSMKAFGLLLNVNLPRIISPKKSYYGFSRERYGVRIDSDHISITLGSDWRWGSFLPWTQWRLVRRSIYGLNGEHLQTIFEKDLEKGDIDRLCEFKKNAPNKAFLFRDFDGEEITATTYIYEMEWRFGEKWCSWLSLFRKPSILRELRIKFSSETGEEKGSWKGGILGHSIKMDDGELHESAFRRYCEKYRMTFVGEGSADDK